MPFPIKAKSHGQQWEVVAPLSGPTLLEFLQNQEVPIRSSCRGKGLCHQCRVKVTKGLAPVAAADRKFFSEKLLQQGWRLGCQLRPKAAMELEFPQVYQLQEDLHIKRCPVSPWWLALDAGTTGLELSAIDKKGPWCNLKAVNRQITMGADIMTRLESVQHQGIKPLRQKLFSQLKHMLATIEKQAQGQHFTGRLVAAGNSVMASFLANLSVDQLGVSPHRPASYKGQRVDHEGFQLETLPLLYNFVGGDLWAGLFYLWQKGKRNNPGWILLDVGTNSEILFWDGNHLLVSSTPAGPAFEGSNISIGMRAEAGAILDPTYAPEGGWQFKVINGDIPRGLCGSSLIQMVAEAVKSGLIKTDGEIVEEQSLCLQDDLVLSQADVREFQLAKSAIRTGLEMVMKAVDQKAECLLVAGAFGKHLPVEASYSLGLLPEIPVTTLGNTSLLGTMAWGEAHPELREEFTDWVNCVKKPLDLALRDDFQKMFVSYMNLEPGANQ